MRVALFTETYLPNVNGVVAHVKTLKNGLESLGHEVLVVAADKHCKHHYIEDGFLHCPATEFKRFYGFGVAPPISHKRQRMIADFKPDIIHIHHEFGIGLSGLIAARILKIPLVYTLHTMYDQYVYYIAPRPFLRAATKFSHFYERFIAQCATALTGPSQKCEEYFRRIGVQKEVNLIPNTADLDSFNPQKVSRPEIDAFKQKYNIPEGKMLVCFVGRLGKEKSVDVLLEYWAKTIKPEDGLHLVVIGEGPDKAALELLAEALKIKDMVTFTGLIKHDKIPACYAACDVFASASLSEMNSISMLEAMASGLPVLQRYDELNANQIASGVNGFLYHDEKQMAEKLLEIRAMSPGELAALKERVIGTVLSYGSSELADYMLGVYQRAIDDRAVPTKRRALIRPLRRKK